MPNLGGKWAPRYNVECDLGALSLDGPACLFPDDNAGPAVMLVRWRSDDAVKPVLVLIQVKLAKGPLADNGRGLQQTRA